jgi:hypothetical protein
MYIMAGLLMIGFVCNLSVRPVASDRFAAAGTSAS